MGKKLHIIAFDVPYPPNYGGIADVFYKLKSLHEAGARIIYHCYYYKGKNPPTKELEKYCETLHYYERKSSFSKLLFSKLPYVVASRNDTILLMNVLMDPAPILIDGIQCAYWLRHEDFYSQKILFRANNIEHEYYEGLAQWEKNIFKRMYLRWEARKLRNFEWQIRHSDTILSVAKQDIPHFEQYAKTIHLPPFFDDTQDEEFIESQALEERYILFQGNLSVTENDYSAMYIVEKIAPQISHKIVIAGKKPSGRLKLAASKVKNVQLISSPSHDAMKSLIRQAHIHLLITFQQTGVKLKLLHALQSGKHIIINSKMDDSGIFAEMCEVVNDTEATVKKIEELIPIDFTKEMKDLRDEKFNAIYSNQKKAEKILGLI
ncbi:MAG: glycosyltransferase [Crocinitomicaceae bacterium]